MLWLRSCTANVLSTNQDYILFFLKYSLLRDRTFKSCIIDRRLNTVTYEQEFFPQTI